MELFVFFERPIYLLLFRFIPIRYHEFIFSPLAVGVIYLLDRAKNSRFFKTGLKKADSWKREWFGAGLRLLVVYTLKSARILFA